VTTYYLDTSALIKRYVDETGSDWLRATCNTQPPPSVIVVHLIIVEMTSALARRTREGTLTPEEYAQIQAAFRSDCLHEYEIVNAVGGVIDQARRLLEKYPLRAYDAVHLATGIVSNQRLLINGLSRFSFCAPMIG